MPRITEPPSLRTSRDPPSCGRTDWTHGSPAFGRASWPRPLGPTSMSPADGRAQLHRAWPWPRCAVGRDPPHAKAGGRPLHKSYPAELRWRGPDTYDFRPADRTDDYSASDFVISEALQQTDFDGIRHGVLSGLTASGRNRTQLRIRGIVGAVPTILTTLGARRGPGPANWHDRCITD